jgi:hypothetical protein
VYSLAKATLVNIDKGLLSNMPRRKLQNRGLNTCRLHRALKRHNAMEPIIAHLKNDEPLSRNYLGDAVLGILCGAGHNF